MLRYLDVLAYLHDTIRPRTYLEIGVGRGDSLRLAREDAICVGVDPEPDLASGTERHCHIEVATSDAFFAGTRPRELFGDHPVDMVFVDGMHLFECALRDFINAEALAGPESLVVLHDCLPQDAVTSSRERSTGFWTGDVWKLVLCLIDHRPDLELSIVDVPPSGLCLVRGLNPHDRTLRDGYDALVEQYLPMDFGQWQARSADVLRHTTFSSEARYWRRRVEEQELRTCLADAEARAAALDRQLRAVYASTSWRVTAPMRRVSALVTRSPCGVRGTGAVMGETTPRSLAWQSWLWRRRRVWRTRGSARHGRDGPVASVLLVTYNRLGMLRECVSSVLANTDDVEHELIVWDNASTDGTGEYLDSVAFSHPHVRVIHHGDNIGMNAYAACVRLARGEYILSMDDDVIEVPRGWLSEMIRAFDAVPRAGYLAANVVQDETTNGAKPPQENYVALDYGDGVVIECGPAGGWCTMTSQSVVKRIGNFLERPGRIFYLIDGDFSARCVRRFYRIGIVRNVTVYHAAGVAKNKEYGYLELCRQKYAEDPEFERHLAATLAAAEDSDERPG